MASVFLLHGGVFDYVDAGRTVHEYLAEAFGASFEGLAGTSFASELAP